MGKIENTWIPYRHRWCKECEAVQPWGHDWTHGKQEPVPDEPIDYLEEEEADF